MNLSLRAAAVNTAFLTAAERLLGPRGVLRDQDAAHYQEDVRQVYRGSAVAVVRPRSTDDVSALMQLCSQHDVVVIPQGGNTSLCGGSVPRANLSRPTVVLSLERMNTIESIDPLRSTATVQAGCILEAVQDAAADVDRLLSLDWGARGTATIGGAISTNGGGNNVLRYANTREQVLGLEVVLPDGQIWNGLRSLRKDTAGYDVKQMFIGAEGTLGIITRATLKLHARPTHTQSLFMELRELSVLPNLLALARDIGGPELQCCELLHGGLLSRAIAANPVLQMPVNKGAKWYVLLALAGGQPVSDRLERIFQAACDKGWADDAVVSQNIAQERQLWLLREEMAPYRYIRGEMLKWDVSVPIDVIPEFLRRVDEAVRSIDARAELISFGHVGDGNLHTSVWFEGAPSREAVIEPAERILSAVDSIVAEVGGSLCAEHGVGIEMVDRVRAQKAPIELDLMKRIKLAMDPRSLLNPGVGLA